MVAAEAPAVVRGQERPTHEVVDRPTAHVRGAPFGKHVPESSGRFCGSPSTGAPGVVCLTGATPEHMASGAGRPLR